MTKQRMMTVSSSGHTEFDDMVLLAERAGDVVIRRVIERLSAELRRLERELTEANEAIHNLANEQCRAERRYEKAEDLLYKIRSTAESVVMGCQPDLGIEELSRRTKDAINNYFEERE